MAKPRRRLNQPLTEANIGTMAALVGSGDAILLDGDAHASLFDGGNMDERVLGAVARLDKSIPFSGVEPLNCSCWHLS